MTVAYFRYCDDQEKRIKVNISYISGELCHSAYQVPALEAEDSAYLFCVRYGVFARNRPVALAWAFSHAGALAEVL
jgi:hypothetical protein